MPIRIAGIAIFLFAGLAQFYFIAKVTRRLREGHPDVWQQVSRRAGFSEQAVGGFILMRGDKRLKDKSLSGFCRLGACNYYLVVLGAGLWIAGDALMSLVTKALAGAE